MSFRLLVFLVAFLSFISGAIFIHLDHRPGDRFLLVAAGAGLLFVTIFLIKKHLERQIVQALSEPMNFNSQGLFDDILDPMLKGLITLLREKAETASRLAEIRSRFEAILNNMVEGVVITSSSGQVLLANSAFGRILGLEEGGAIGKMLGLTIRATTVHELVEEVFRTRAKVVREVEYIESGKKRTLNVVGTISDPCDGSGRNYGIFLFYDLSTVRSLERIRKDFVANVSHEIRSPLTSIRGYTEALLDGALANPELAGNFLRIISGQSDRLSRLVNDLLELSRLESGAVSLNPKEVDLALQCQRLREIFSGRIQERKIELILDFPDPFSYVSDESMMDLVLTNLLDNAIKYSHEGGKVRISVGNVPGKVLIQIEDEGIGIPKEDLSRVFERFYRVDRARSGSIGGTGLGLSIVRHVMGVLGGRVELRSDLDAGTVVRLLLPEGALQATGQPSGNRDPGSSS